MEYGTNDKWDACIAFYTVCNASFTRIIWVYQDRDGGEYESYERPDSDRARELESVIEDY